MTARERRETILSTFKYEADSTVVDATIDSALDAHAAEAVAAEREAIRKMIEDIRAKPWHRSALVQSAERETCDRILVELDQRTKPAQEGTNDV